MARSSVSVARSSIRRRTDGTEDGLFATRLRTDQSHRDGNDDQREADRSAGDGKTHPRGIDDGILLSLRDPAWYQADRVFDARDLGLGQRRIQLQAVVVPGREHQVRAPAVGGKPRVYSLHLEGGAVEMRRFNRAVEADAQHPTVRHVGADLRDRQIEPVGIRVPHRLFGAVLCIDAMRRVKGDPAANGERAGGFIDGNQCTEGWIISVVDHEE